jgi:predicted Zn-dependent peptidase
MIQIKTLPNGARIVHEYMDQVRSAAVVFWVGHGSRHEPAGMSGVSHAIEHMLFKGTETRTAAEIAAAMDAIGGQVNAYTTKESTCYYARALDSHLPAAIDILGDMFFNARFDEEAWETERGVIVEEIAMCEDHPDDLVYQHLFASVYKDLPLGRAIIGTNETLADMTAEKLKAYKCKNYRPCDVLVSVAGHYAPSDLERIEELLSAMSPAECPPLEACSYTPAFHLCEKQIEQNHIVLGFPGLPMGREHQYASCVMSSVLGAGMSSRLFQKVREEHGLCYSVYSYTTTHRDTGVAGVYTALGSETEQKALELIREVVELYVKEGPTESELTRAREQLKANDIMNEESTMHRAIRIAYQTFFFGNALEIDETIKRVNAVTREHVMELSARIFDFDKISLSVVGKPEDEAVYRGLICPNG